MSFIARSSWMRGGLLLLVLSAVCRGDYVEDADDLEVRWTSANSNTNINPRRGNAVLATGTYVAVTSGDGKLAVWPTSEIQTNADEENADDASWVWDPAVALDLPATARLSCTGGVIWHNANGQQLFVYAVTVNDIETMVVGISAAERNLQWSTMLPGQAVGTPILGADSLYVVHNTPTGGRISVLDIADIFQVSVVATFPDANPLTNEVPLTFSPPVGTTVERPGGGTQDVVAFGARALDPNDTDGALYALVSTTTSTLTNANTHALLLVTDRIGPVWERPALAIDASQIYVGMGGATLSGWTPESSFASVVLQQSTSALPRWVFQRGGGGNGNDRNAPLPNAPTLTADNRHVCAAGPDEEIFCIQTQGRLAWSYDITGDHVAPAVFSNDDQLVTFVEAESGVVRQIQVATGRVQWEWSCRTSRQCRDAPVEADFAVSPSGNLLYLADTDGQLVALQVATFATDEPTAAPTAVAATEPPTVVPTTAPVTELPTTTAPVVVTVVDEEDDPAEEPVDGETNPDTPVSEPVDSVTSPPVAAPTAAPVAPTTEDGSGAQVIEPSAAAAVSNANQLPMILGSVIGVLLVLIVVAACCLWRKHRRSKEKQTQLRQQQLSVARSKDLDDAEAQYAEDCRKLEEETLNSISGRPKTPSILKKSSSLARKGRRSPSHGRLTPQPNNAGTPETLHSIDESEEITNVDLGTDEDGSDMGFELSLEPIMKIEPTRNLDNAFSTVDSSTTTTTTTSVSPDDGSSRREKVVVSPVGSNTETDSVASTDAWSLQNSPRPQSPPVSGAAAAAAGKKSSFFGKKSPVPGKKSPLLGKKSPVPGKKSPLLGKKSPVPGKKPPVQSPPLSPTGSSVAESEKRAKSPLPAPSTLPAANDGRVSLSPMQDILALEKLRKSPVESLLDQDLASSGSERDEADEFDDQSTAAEFRKVYEDEESALSGIMSQMTTVTSKTGEPGQIQSSANRPDSPSGMMSADGSLYLDASTIVSMTQSIMGGDAKSVATTKGPDDEPGKLRPRAQYLESRPRAQSPPVVREQWRFGRTDARDKEFDARRNTGPAAFQGKSLRRSKAEDLSDGKVRGASFRTGLEARRTVRKSAADPPAGADATGAAGPAAAAQVTKDPWSSFMNELSKAEQSFFQPSFGRSGTDESRPPPPPPPPPQKQNRRSSSNGRPSVQL